MKVGIMQPYFFPYLGYWQLINSVDKFVIYDDVNFIKGGWINRNNLLINGGKKLFSIRLSNSSPNKLINETELINDHVYKKKLLRTLEGYYQKSPFFYDVIPVISNIILQEEDNLAKYLEFSIKQMCNYLSMNTEIIISSGLNKNNELKGQDKVIDICKVLGADKYINSIGGQKLYSYSDFNNEGIELNFLKPRTIEYEQFDNDFIPNLSIIDVMMFNDREKVIELLNDYQLLNENTVFKSEVYLD